MNRNSTRVLVESAIMVALSTVLSILKLVEMPCGGSVTFAQMLPIIVLSYRHGLKAGMGSGLVFAVIQQLLGLKYISYFTTPASIIALILLDYILAFVFVGLGGIFRRRVKNQALAMTLGALTVCFIRYICHTVSGCTIWAGLSIPDSAALIYSLGYNATYMVPETIVLLVATYYVGGTVDFTRRVPSRILRKEGGAVTALYCIAGGLVALATVVDVILIAPYTQDPVSGAYDLSYLSGANLTPVLTVSAVCLVGAVVLAVIAKVKSSAKNA